jgi:GT2 family glycosyltransferase
MSPVNIVVPVYRDVSLTRRCLDSLDASGLPLDCRVTLIDDASPEDGMADMLKTFVEARLFSAPLVVEYELLRNAENLGFVASANRGMAHCPEHDVVLLNSDTEVPPGWLQRLRAAAYRRKDIGTVTPFSNCGSLASYPVPNAENAMPAGSSLERLDRFFQAANADVTIDIPIGVGFCLFIRRDCLDDTGCFDEIAFGKGYGEENDFCLRASKKGWAHVLAADCFVFHKGRGSFGREKDELVRQSYVFLSERYPNYPVLLQNHFADDPARHCRLRVDFLRLADRSVRFFGGRYRTYIRYGADCF